MDQAQAYAQVTQKPHEAQWSHELLAGAASYAAARAYEAHVQTNGVPASHDQAKAMLAGFAGAFIDREAETRGLDFIDKQKAKHDATKQAEAQLQ